MIVTVAICTWNRCGLLRSTLARLTEIVVPRGLEWELIVVDNNSTDDTAAVIESFANRLPLRRVLEEQMGLSNARNAAVQASRGQYILWTDDDVLVDHHWLEAMCEAFERHPDAAFFGGPIEPLFEGQPPRWLADDWRLVADAYALRDFGSQELPLTTDRLPFGANYAVRTAEQRAHSYNPMLGRRGAQMTAGEETEVLLALLAEGCTGWWTPAASVKHFIPTQRQTEEYLRSFHEGIGRYLGERDARQGAVTPVTRLYAQLRKWAALARLPISRRLPGPRWWLEDLHIAHQYKGRLEGYAEASVRGEPKGDR